MNITNNKKDVVINSLNKVNSLLKRIITTVSDGGISVTITAEPKILEIKINESLDKEQICKRIIKCINSALSQSILKVTKETLNQIEGK